MARTLQRPPPLALMYARAVTVGLVGRGETLPDLELEMEGVAIDRERLSRYRDVCGFPPGDDVPATYSHVVAFPLALRLMTDRRFPLAVLGLVHARNRITQHRPVSVRERLSVRVQARDLRAHEKGSAFDLVAEARVGDEPVWSSLSCYLRRGDDSADGEAHEIDVDGDGAGDIAQQAAGSWEVGAEVSPAYAAVSGDRNPHHLHPLLARAFGFPRLLAHGMWSKARCLAALEDDLPGRFTIDVAFRRPLLVPATVVLTAGRDRDRRRFALRDDDEGKPYLTGTIESEGR